MNSADAAKETGPKDTVLKDSLPPSLPEKLF